MPDKTERINPHGDGTWSRFTFTCPPMSHLNPLSLSDVTFQINGPPRFTDRTASGIGPRRRGHVPSRIEHLPDVILCLQICFCVTMCWQSSQKMFVSLGKTRVSIKVFFLDSIRMFLIDMPIVSYDWVPTRNHVLPRFKREIRLWMGLIDRSTPLNETVTPHN